MCQFSAFADNTRDARQGEDLVVSTAPHGGSHWLTEPGKPDCAVCIPDSAVLAVQIPNQPVRGANFAQRKIAAASEQKKQALMTNNTRRGTILNTLQQTIINDFPVVPLWFGCFWETYNTTNYIGFPTATNYFARGGPQNGADLELALLSIRRSR